MGTLLELNYILKINQEQGFPQTLDYQKHKKEPIEITDLKKQVFEFKKSGIRMFHTPPILVYLAQEVDDKWLYWGQVEIIELKFDMIQKTTKGKYRFKKIFTPEEMRQAQDTIHYFDKSNFFK